MLQNITDLRRLWGSRDGLKVALKFFDIDIRDEGEYICYATNKFGQSQYKVKVELAPGKIKYIKLSSVPK